MVKQSIICVKGSVNLLVTVSSEKRYHSVLNLSCKSGFSFCHSCHMEMNREMKS